MQTLSDEQKIFELSQIWKDAEYNFAFWDKVNVDWDEEYIFIGIHDTRITTNSLRRRQELNCKRLGFYQKSPHKGRKTYGSILLDNNLDSNMIMQQMGHTDISTT